MSDVLDPFRLDGKVAVLTGGASGIGRATAEVMAAAGAKVVVGDIDLEGVNATATGINEAGGDATARECDVTRRDQVAALVDAALETYGRLDVMCNIAGAMFPGAIEDVKDDLIDAGLDLNLKGTIYGCQEAIRAMKPNGSGSIINVSSGAIDLAVADIGIYAFTKAAVAMLTRTLSMEVGQYGIRVNAVAPGATITKFTTWRLHKDDGTIDQEAYDEFIEMVEGMSPLGMSGEAIDQAHLMLYLASDAARFTTGNIHRANGGSTTMF